ncbi:MAG: biopolymer transporter ExbD [Bacteroidaceae bacterium]|nr:biopolymer transporter ExbD [Bacteroidaceae bacterium]
MARKKRKMPSLNTTSTADISFMLLIFFLVTTSMDTDRGLGRTLPKPPEDEEQQNEIDVKERNLLNIRVNKDNYLMIGDDFVSLSDVKPRAKEFIANFENLSNLPERNPKSIEVLENSRLSSSPEAGKYMTASGKLMVTDKHVISVQTDRGTSYWVYFEVQNELVAAYNELRNDLAKAAFGRSYENCTQDEQDAIRHYFPQKISEAEPKKYGKAL